MLIRKTLEHRVLPVPFHILTLWGVWCPAYVDTWLRRLYSIFTYFVIISETLVTIEVFINMIILIHKQQFEIDVFFMFTSLIIGLYKALNILLNRERIVHILIKGFENRWQIPRDDSEKKILLNCTIESWRIHLVYAGVCLTSVSMKVIGPMIKQDADRDDELPVPGWYPYDTNKPLYYWLTYVQQMFVCTAIISMHIAADTMVSGILLQSCTQLKLLKNRLRNSFQLCEYMDECSYNSSSKIKVETELLKQYIRDHQFIYSYANILNNGFSGWLLAVLTVVVPNICINVYLLSFSESRLNVDLVTSLALFLTALFQIYLPCWYGNEIMLHSAEVVNIVYEMDWLELEPSTRKTLIIIMIRAAKPIQLTVAHLVPMNIESFLSILKTSYTVLNVLQQTAK